LWIAYIENNYTHNEYLYFLNKDKLSSILLENLLVIKDLAETKKNLLKNRMVYSLWFGDVYYIVIKAGKEEIFVITMYLVFFSQQ